MDPTDKEAGGDPWHVRARTWMVELEGSIAGRVKPGLVRQAGSCNERISETRCPKGPVVRDPFT